jgi:hypothetical protein
MKLMKFISFFLFAILCCTSYAHENKYIFVGQNENDNCAQTAFILELDGEDLEDHIQKKENGEVYLKVNKIIAVPKGTLIHFANLVNATGSPNTAMAANAMVDNIDEEEVRCRGCRFTYYARPGHRDCPRCHTSN